MNKAGSKSVGSSSKNQQKSKDIGGKTQQKMPVIYKHTPSHDLGKSDLLWSNDKSYFRRKLNQGAQMGKSALITSSRFTIENNPEKTYDNSDFYRRQLYRFSPREPEIKAVHYDIMNNPKKSFSGRNQGTYYSLARQNSSKSQSKGGSDSMRKTLTHLMMFQPEITAKIGATTNRDFTIRRPQLKVGSNVFIDTYSPF